VTSSPPPTLVFDLDGTLADSLSGIIQSFRDSFGALGLEAPTPEQVRAEIGLPLEDMYLTFAPPEAMPALVAWYREDYAAHLAERSQLYPGVREVLQDARAHGYRIAVATTKRSGVARLLADAVGLTPLVHHIQGTDAFPHKPAPDVIYRALAAVGGEGAWMVWDTHLDILAGRAAGLRTYAVTWGTQDAAQLALAHPDRLEPDLEALRTLL
jgi:phosphoglycolate phosphatase